MNKTYVIHWRSKTNGRIGTGTTRFDREAADRLVEELNRDYPEIEHRIVNLGSEGESNPIISFPFAEPEAVAE
jgi:hypothetical protein